MKSVTVSHEGGKSTGRWALPRNFFQKYKHWNAFVHHFRKIIFNLLKENGLLPQHFWVGNCWAMDRKDHGFNGMQENLHFFHWRSHIIAPIQIIGGGGGVDQLTPMGKAHVQFGVYLFNTKCVITGVRYDGRMNRSWATSGALEPPIKMSRFTPPTFSVTFPDPWVGRNHSRSQSLTPPPPHFSNRSGATEPDHISNLMYLLNVINVWEFWN